MNVPLSWVSRPGASGHRGAINATYSYRGSARVRLQICIFRIILIYVLRFSVALLCVGIKKLIFLSVDFKK